jgi:hypothetical protein
MKALAVKAEDVLDDLRKGHIEIPRAKEYFNGVGKIISTRKVLLDYRKVKNTNPDYIDEYLEDD